MKGSGHDYRTIFANASSDARAEFARILDANVSVEALAAWILWLRTSHLESVENASKFFSAVRDNSETNPLAWCKSRGVKLAPEIEKSLTDVRDSESPLVAYVLGRAAMEAALSEPLGTAGLTLPYRVVAKISNSSGSVSWELMMSWLNRMCERMQKLCRKSIERSLKLRKILLARRGATIAITFSPRCGCGVTP